MIVSITAIRFKNNVTFHTYDNPGLESQLTEVRAQNCCPGKVGRLGASR
ncbi:hypothetical protein SAMN05720354_1298 [Nitrosospira sp. Nsp1]|nr:hypothetical protein SAMN05720354_1298 [Nitrosospira sp. Nsp1]